MPDLARLRFMGGQTAAVPVFAREIQPEEVVDFPGRVLATKADLDAHGIAAAPEDAILVAMGNPPEVRAFPTSLWRDETPVAPKKSKE